LQRVTLGRPLVAHSAKVPRLVCENGERSSDDAAPSTSH
jgi:hypothetical protein